MNTSLSVIEEYDGRRSKGMKREELIAYAEQIPPLPHVVLRVLKLLKDPNSDADQFADAVSPDAGLTSALLKLANSAIFARVGRVNSVVQAVSTVGLAKLHSLVLATALRGMAKCEMADQLVWKNSLATAMIGRRLAEELKKQWADEIFLMGLLHGLGQFVMLANTETRAAYSRVLRRVRETRVNYVTAELEEIGFSHPMIGALVANRWNFPPDVCQTILRYSDSLEGIETPTDRKLAMIKLADLIAHAAGFGHPEGFPVDQGTMQQLSRWLGFIRSQGEIVPILIKEAQDQYQAESQIWDL